MKVLVLVLSFIFGLGSAFALDTYYDNKQGYVYKNGYNNRIPYEAFFHGEHAPVPENIKIQKNTRFGNIQAVVPINQTEEKVEQKGLEK